MRSTLAQLRQRAQKIPSGNVGDDVNCLCDLISESVTYVQFCVSRFSQIARYPEAISGMKKIVDRETNSEVYIPITNVLLSVLSGEEAKDFLYPLLFSKRGPSFCFTILSHSALPTFIEPLLIALFTTIPSPEDLQIRDDIFFRYLSIGCNPHIVFECMQRISVNLAPAFYQEFLLILSSVVSQKWFDSNLIGVSMDFATTVIDQSPIVSIFEHSSFKFPKVFYDWITQNTMIKPTFLEERLTNEALDRLPPLLRNQVIQPESSTLDTPAFCRAIRKANGFYTNQIERIKSEKSPQLLHDLLVARPVPIMLSLDTPMCFTVLADNALNGNQNIRQHFVSLFQSCFVQVDESSSLAIQCAAAQGLMQITERNPQAILNVFPHVLRLVALGCKEAKIFLFNSIAQAAGNDALDPEFIWRAFHNIRTISKENLNFEDIVHYSVISLIDPDNSLIASELIQNLMRIDRNGVQSALLRLPPYIITKFPELVPLRPSIHPTISKNEDILPSLVYHQLDGQLTTVKFLQLATAFVCFFDAFPNEKESWINLLVTAGSCAFNLNAPKDFVEKLNNYSEDPIMKASALFSMSVLLSYGLVQPKEFQASALNLTKDSFPLVRMLAFYTMAFCPDIDLGDVPENIIKNSHSPLEDVVGAGYYITSRFQHHLDFLEQSKTSFNNRQFAWSHIAAAQYFLGFSSNTQVSDSLGMAQYVYLMRNYPESGKIVDEFLSSKQIDATTAFIAVCGFIPSMPFRINEFNADERQRKILDSCVDDSIFVKELLKRPRLAHEMKVEIGRREVMPAMDRWKAQWNSMKPEDCQMVLEQLSNSQKAELIEKSEDYSLAAAIYLLDYPKLGNLLTSKEWNKEMLKMVFKNPKMNISMLVNEMLTKPESLTAIADILFYAKYEEFASSSVSMAMLPHYLTDLDLDEKFFKKLASFNMPISKEIGQCLLLKRPELFEDSEGYYALFDAV